MHLQSWRNAADDVAPGEVVAEVVGGDIVVGFVIDAVPILVAESGVEPQPAAAAAVLADNEAEPPPGPEPDYMLRSANNSTWRVNL